MVNGRAIKDLIKEIPGRSWNPQRKVWELPPTRESYERLLEIAPNLEVSQGSIDLIRQREKWENAVANQKDIPWQEQEPLKPMPIKATPFQHQIAAYNTVGTIFNLWTSPKSAGAGLYMEQGTGKTLTTIAVAGTMFLDGVINKMLVVAPSSVVPVWPNEFESFADFPHQCRVLEGTGAKRAELLNVCDPLIGD